MNFIESYIHFCKRFHKSRIPKLKFKELNDRYKTIYNKFYGISEEDIYKASFIIFLISFSFLLIFSIIILYFHILIIIFYTFLFSLAISYKFSIYLLNKIKKNESIINAMLYLIKIYFSLIQKSLKPNSDCCMAFITLIKDYNLPLLENFKEILRMIHEGELPEKVLMKISTPSEDFNRYLKDLLSSNFNHESNSVNFKENTLERKFKIYLREIESKLSIIFFIGLFFPIGLCFLLSFQLVNLIFAFLSIFFFFFILKSLFKKFIKQNNFLIGFISDYSKIEKKRFYEFFLFLKSFANNLRRDISPEYAFLKSYSQNLEFYHLIQDPLKNQVTSLLNISCSFHEMINNLKFELNSIRFKIILEVIEKFVDQNAFYSSEKIFDLLSILSKHQKLEEKFETIIKGEKFKVFFFLFLLPLIIGFIGGMFPLFVLLNNNIQLNNNFSLKIIFNMIFFKEIVIIFLFLLSTISISSYYFLKVINYNSRDLIIFITDLIFILSFLISLLNMLNFI